MFYGSFNERIIGSSFFVSFTHFFFFTYVYLTSLQAHKLLKVETLFSSLYSFHIAPWPAHDSHLIHVKEELSELIYYLLATLQQLFKAGP